MIDLRFEGLPALEKLLRGRSQRLARRIREAVIAASIDVMSDARDQKNWSTYEGGGIRPGAKIPKRASVSLKARLYRPNPPPGPLRALSGRLRNSIGRRLVATPTGWKGVVGTSVEYARIHELGGTVTQPPRSYRGHAAGDSLRSGRKAKGAMNRRTFGSRTFQIPARPYLGPALERRREAVLERLSAPMRSGIGE